ncbi:hypothetical protein EJB05_57768, partial [Eragrostis curvula]
LKSAIRQWRGACSSTTPDAFSHRPVSPFPVEFVTGPRVKLSHSISTVPHGPLRRNRTAGVLHPSRLGLLLVPLQREAAEGLIAAVLSGAARSGGVVVRDGLHTAVLTLMLRLCFGDGVDARGVRAVQRVLRDFNLLMVDAGELARSSGGNIILQVPDLDDTSMKRALTDDEKVTLVWEFLDAGTETVVSCVEWTLAQLIAKPHVQEKLHHDLSSSGSDKNRDREGLRDLPYLRAVILESLRLHPPMEAVRRDVGAEGAALVGATMPQDSTVMRFTIVTGDTVRDGKAWTDPQRVLTGSVPRRWRGGVRGPDSRAQGDQDDAVRCRDEALSGRRARHDERPVLPRRTCA